MKFVASKFLFLLVISQLLPSLGYADTAQTHSIEFIEHPSINLKVEEFSNALIDAFAPSLNESTLTFTRDSNGDIINSIKYGALSGKFEALLPSTASSSTISLNFAVEMEVEPSKQKEYQINLILNGEASHPMSVLNSLNHKLLKQCSIQKMQACSSLNDLEPNTDPKVFAYTLLVTWKTLLFEKLISIENEEFQTIQADFLEYLDERIQITQTEQSTELHISLDDLADKFRAKAGRFLNNKKLIDYSFHNIHLVVTDDSISVDAHLVKYHVIGPFNGLVQVAKIFQNTIEDSDAGMRIGQALRDNSEDISDQFLNEANYSDSLWAAMEYVKVKAKGSKNSNPVTKDELDLGLE